MTAVEAYALELHPAPITDLLGLFAVRTQADTTAG